MISHGSSARGTPWPPGPRTWSWAARLSLPPILARPLRTSPGHAPDDLFKARVPSVRRDEDDRGAGARRQTRDCPRGDRYFPRSVIDGDVRDRYSGADDRWEKSGEVPNQRAGAASAAGWQTLTQRARLFRGDQGMAAPVLLPARFIHFGARRLFLAFAHHDDAVRG